MSFNVTTCHRCGENTYDPDYRRCLNNDCRLAPLSEGLRLVTLAAMVVLMVVLIISNHWPS